MIQCAQLHRQFHAAIENRASLDRRRLEDAHIKFAVLQIMMWYSKSMSSKDFPLMSDMNSVLQTFTSKYYEIFTAQYAGTFLACVNTCKEK